MSRMYRTAALAALLAGWTTATFAATNTVAYYDFEGTAGNAINSLAAVSGSNQVTLTATGIGTPTYSAIAAPSGGGATSGEFADAAYLLSAPNALPTAANNNIGVEAWVRPTSLASFNFVYNIGGDAGDNDGHGILNQSNQHIALNSGLAFLGHTNALANEWVHVAYVADSGTSRFYVNGVERGAAGLPNVGTGHFAIGGHEFDSVIGNGIFDGQIDNLRVFDFTAGDFDSATDFQGLSNSVANLAADYPSEAGLLPGNAQPATPGTVSGVWRYLGDADNDPNNGGLVGLTFGSAGLEGGDGFTGTGSVFGGCCGDFPIVSDDGLFDGVTTLPDGALAIHPGQTGGNGVPPEYVVIEYEATETLLDASLLYLIDEANGGGDGIDWRIVDEAGTELASGLLNGNAEAATIALGDLAAGDSLFLVVGNGAADNPGTDQTFVNLQILGSTVIPEPTTIAIWTLLGVGCLVALRLKRRKTS